VVVSVCIPETPVIPKLVWVWERFVVLHLVVTPIQHLDLKVLKVLLGLEVKKEQQVVRD
tara:strand:- start:204 stop:380 length:177 start_codon:yes stop_codon:yes gene_type:complete